MSAEIQYSTVQYSANGPEKEISFTAEHCWILDSPWKVCKKMHALFIVQY